MLDGPGYSGLLQIKATAQAIERDPHSDWTGSRAEEIVRFVTALIEREDRGRAILEEMLARENLRSGRP